MKKIVALIVGIAGSIGTAHAQDWNVDVFGGGSLENMLAWSGTDYTVNSGQTYGIGISKSNVFASGLELEF